MKFTQKRTNVLVFMTPILMLFMLGCGSDDDQNQPDLSYLEGNYVGTWNSKTPSKTFTDYPISATIETSGANILVGNFFYTSNFEVCCSEVDNDGTFTIEVNGNEATSFRLNDVGTNCSGVFTGAGAIREEDNAFVIDITGTDCEGAHVGQIVLIKQ